ncbi:MAG: GTP-binding protein [Armatimonadota bacterium]|nr:GTP-binding protein [Armatimonadota bacterium]
MVGTAGHIDHGKSALVRALTGIDPDRLEEEKRRGMTIDLGFAHLDLPDGLRVGFVDVPGHERLIRNMLAGAAGFDLVILVVAADEGVMPQTREHLEILQFLQILCGIVAITKCDLVDDEWLDLVQGEVRAFVRARSWSRPRWSRCRRGRARVWTNSCGSSDRAWGTDPRATRTGRFGFPSTGRS